MIFLSYALFLLLFLFTVTVHEFAHGCVAYYRGDNTAKDAGRLTLNPLKHIDPLWTVVLPVLLVSLGLPAIGMAKPVPVDYRNLFQPRQDMIWVALAGPASNILFASLLAGLYHVFPAGLLLAAVYLNLGLALFNLFPIPPLDGSKILLGMLPLPAARFFSKIERYGFWILLILVWFGLVWKMVLPGIDFFCHVFQVPAIGPEIAS